MYKVTKKDDFVRNPYQLDNITKKITANITNTVYIFA